MCGASEKLTKVAAPCRGEGFFSDCCPGAGDEFIALY